VKVIPPSVNASGVDFAVVDGAVLYSLAALKNVGAGAIEHIVKAREEGGPFKLAWAISRKRIDARIVNKRALESMAKAGAFDCLNPNRAQVLDAVESILSMANRTRVRRRPGRTTCSAACSPASTSWCCRAAMPGCRWTGWRRNSRRWASISPAIRSTIT
jgi:DNA polymerase III subunit alpha